MPENIDYQTFKKNVPVFGDRLNRVENFLVPGMPDINFCSGGVECWIEQKSPKEPVRPSTPLFGSNPRVTQDQMNWFLAQRKAGGRCYFLVTTNRRWMLLPGDIADDINMMTVADLMEHAIWAATKPVRAECWMKLRDKLRQ